MVRKDTWYDFNLLNLFNPFVLWPNMWSIQENVLCVLDKNVYSAAVGWNVLYNLVYNVVQVLCFLDLLFEHSIHYEKWSIEISYYYSVTVYLSLQFCQCMLYIFRYSDVGCIYLFIIYISSLLCDPFVTVLWQFLTLVTVFGLKSIVSDINITAPTRF